MYFSSNLGCVKKSFFSRFDRGYVNHSVDDATTSGTGYCFSKNGSKLSDLSITVLEQERKNIDA